MVGVHLNGCVFLTQGQVVCPHVPLSPSTIWDHGISRVYRLKCTGALAGRSPSPAPYTNELKSQLISDCEFM